MEWTWWMWLVAGMILLAAEALTPGGFFLFFFGAGAVVVGLLSAFGLAGPLWMQLMLFSAISVASLLLLRNRMVQLMGKKAGSSGEMDALIGEVATPAEEIAAGAVGKAELRGTVWSVRNDGEAPLRKGQRSKVVLVQGLTLHLRAE